jgi:hypothetical protein
MINWKTLFPKLYLKDKTMKKIIVTSIICCSIFAAYVAGQNQTKEKRIENCCCKHTQQIAEDLHWIREKMEKPFIAPPDIIDPGNPPSIPKKPVQRINIDF